ncbi:MAG: hypothetical protein RL442_2886, partial [Pseudomonadota bacterium]
GWLSEPAAVQEVRKSAQDVTIAQRHGGAEEIEIQKIKFKLTFGMR